MIANVLIAFLLVSIITAVLVTRRNARNAADCLICKHKGAFHDYGICWHNQCWNTATALHKFVAKQERTK